MPAHLSFAEAATLPVAFLTAMYGLADLAGLRAGERLLVHAAAGGVGMAALQLARLRGAEVFATASPPKWELLRRMGIPDDHIASSRDPSFREAFLSATGGRGVDVVLDSLAGDKVEASFDLLPRGGRFIEMGKTDSRDAGEVASAHPGVVYRAFDLIEAGFERLTAMLHELTELVEQGQIQPLPVHAFDLRMAEDAFRFMAKGRSTGKLVLVPPRALDPAGTVLVTGGTGGIAQVTARHLVARHGVRHLVMVSRSGPAAPGVAVLVDELRALGAETVALHACDVGDRDALAAVLAEVPPARPLTAVFHLAAVLDDGLLVELTPARLDTVLRPKVDAAFHLHELTRDADLAAFVLFSSAAGLLGSAAQASYAAANAALDALAARRRRVGLAATSLAWGTWGEVGLVARLDSALQKRLRRSGVVPIDSAGGMRILDEVLARLEPVLAPVQLDRAALQQAAGADSQAVPPVLRALVRPSMRRSAHGGGAAASVFRERLARLAEPDRSAAVLSVVRAEVALVLGLTGPEAVPTDRPLRELGLDSLTAVETRNRLSAAVGHKLPASILFDYPTPQELAAFVQSALRVPAPEVGALRDAVERLERLSTDEIERAGLAERLVGLVARLRARADIAAPTHPSAVEVADEDLLRLVDAELGDTRWAREAPEEK
jgi:type I polyketide synthase PikAII